MSTPRSTGATPIGGNKKRGKGLWLVIALIALLILVALLIASCGGDDDKPDSSTAPTTTASQSAQAQSEQPATSSQAPTTGPGAAGILAADGQSLLGADASKIKDAVGSDAAGSGLKVLSVKDSGFFVGTTQSDQQFVEFGTKVGSDEDDATDTDSPDELPRAGDVVDVKGPVRPAPEDPAKTLKLSATDAQAVTDRGAYINADTVTPTS